MSELKIHKALITSLQSTGLAHSIAYEGVKFEPVQGQPWLRVTMLPATNTPSSLGVGGTDERLGIFQIDVTYPQNIGVGALLQDVDTLLNYYVAGRRFFSEGQCVLVRRTDRSAIRPLDGWQRASVSVNYSAQTIRPEV